MLENTALVFTLLKFVERILNLAPKYSATSYKNIYRRLSFDLLSEYNSIIKVYLPLTVQSKQSCATLHNLTTLLLKVLYFIKRTLIVCTMPSECSQGLITEISSPSKRLRRRSDMLNSTLHLFCYNKNYCNKTFIFNVTMQSFTLYVIIYTSQHCTSFRYSSLQYFLYAGYVSARRLRFIEFWTLVSVLHNLWLCSVLVSWRSISVSHLAFRFFINIGFILNMKKISKRERSGLNK